MHICLDYYMYLSLVRTFEIYLYLEQRLCLEPFLGELLSRGPCCHLVLRCGCQVWPSNNIEDIGPPNNIGVLRQSLATE